MHNAENPSLLGIVARMSWMMFGPLILVILTFLVIKTGNGWLTPVDFGFLAVLCGMILARWLEFQCGSPQTAEGQPATLAHLRRYVIGTILVGLTVWMIANVLGNYVWPA